MHNIMFDYWSNSRWACVSASCFSCFQSLKTLFTCVGKARMQRRSLKKCLCMCWQGLCHLKCNVLQKCKIFSQTSVDTVFVYKLRCTSSECELVFGACASAPEGSQSPVCVCHHSFCSPKPCYSGQRKVSLPSDTGTLRRLRSLPHTVSGFCIVRRKALCSYSAIFDVYFGVSV